MWNYNKVDAVKSSDAVDMIQNVNYFKLFIYIEI